MADQPGKALTAPTIDDLPLTQFLTKYQGDFSRIVPGHINVPSFIGLAAAAVRRDDKLMDAAQRNPASLMMALRHCAALGHMPMKEQYALVPYKNSKAINGIEVVGIEEWRGVVERMFRAGGVQSVHVELVREHDEFRWNRRMVLPDHEFDWMAPDEKRGDLVGVYAWARLLTGAYSECVVMNMHEVRKHEKDTPFWKGQWRPKMVKKTALHQLEGFVPTSPAYRWQVAVTEAGASSGWAGLPDVPTRPALPDPGEPVDAEIVGEPSPAGEADWPEPARPGSGAP